MRLKSLQGFAKFKLIIIYRICFIRMFKHLTEVIQLITILYSIDKTSSSYFLLISVYFCQGP